MRNLHGVYYCIYSLVKDKNPTRLFRPMIHLERRTDPSPLFDIMYPKMRRSSSTIQINLFAKRRELVSPCVTPTLFWIFSIAVRRISILVLMIRALNPDCLFASLKVCTDAFEYRGIVQDYGSNWTARTIYLELRGRGLI